MSYRSFLDPENHRWEVWKVIPTSAERRKEDRRVAAGAAADSYSGIERRTSQPRRREGTERGSFLPSGFDKGWLCFEKEDGEKRRLAPIPEGWEGASTEELWKWCAAAVRVLKCAP